MNPDELINQTKTKLDASTDHFNSELSKIRTGRAHPAMLDGVMVEAYGQPMPIKSVAGIITPEAQLIQINPFDPSNLKAISEAIRNNQNLGLSPTDDGRVVRINIPPLTEESRRNLVKILHQKEEEALISARQARHEAMRKAEEAEKAKQLGKDELNRLQKQIDELIAKQKTEVESMARQKETEITTI